MPGSRPARRRGHGEVVPPLSVSDRIDSLLKEQLETFPSKGELSDLEIENWHKDLGRYKIQAIEFAFEQHRTLAMFFPVPAQIIDLCKTWEPPSVYKGCDPECRAQHGRGYNENDILYLWTRYQQKRDSLPSRSLTDGEINQLLDELDTKRGGPPEWRKSA
jgi:hypothetical protein